MSNDLDFIFKPTVVVTGFGPFTGHETNASWEAVKLMNKEEIEEKHNVEFVPLEISVVYANVDEYVPQLWDQFDPKLMIHVGVSSEADKLTIETQAHRKGYSRMDYWNKCPPNHIHSAEGPIRLRTKLDVDRICKEFNEGCPSEGASAVTSLDAGRYLCEYIYYTSLSKDYTRTLFIHVPSTDVYSSETTAQCLEKVVDLCLQQLNEQGALARETSQLIISDDTIIENEED